MAEATRQQRLQVGIGARRADTRAVVPITVSIGAGVTLAALIGRLAQARTAYAVVAIMGLSAATAFLVMRAKRRYFLCALTMSLPLAGMDFFVGAPPSTFHGGGAQTVPEVNAVDLLAIPALIFFLISRQEKPRLPRAARMAFGGFLAWSAMSIVSSGQRLLGVVSFFDLVKVFALWVCVAKAVRDEEDCRFVANCLAIVVFLQGAIGILQWFYGVPEWSYVLTKGGDPTYLESLDTRSFTRIGGTIGWSTTFAQYIELLTPLCVCLFCVARTRLSTCAYGLAGLVASLAMILTLSRAGWLGLLAGTSVSTIILWGRARPEIRKRIGLAGAAGGLCVLIALPIVIERLQSSDQGSAQNRLPMWSVALKVILANPVVGVGLNAYTEVMHEYDSEGEIAEFSFPPHNVYMFVAAEIGLPGLLLLVVYFVVILRLLARAAREAPLPSAATAAGLLGGLTALLAVHAQVDSSFKQELSLWYAVSVVCGLAVSLGQLGRGRALTRASR
jgi:O-antigen ligase